MPATRNEHCYATLVNIKQTGAPGGIRVALTLDWMSMGNPAPQNFITHEMWYYTHGDSAAYWVEVGVVDGSCSPPRSRITQSSGSIAVPGANGPNFSISISPPCRRARSVNRTKPGFRYAGERCTWDVYYGDVFLGQSTSNCAGATRGMAAGIETTDVSSGTTCSGHLSNWARLDGSTWVPNWGVGTTVDNPVPRGPAMSNPKNGSTHEVVHGSE